MQQFFERIHGVYTKSYAAKSPTVAAQQVAYTYCNPNTWSRKATLQAVRSAWATATQTSRNTWPIRNRGMLTRMFWAILWGWWI
jgi:hypothetical protein